MTIPRAVAVALEVIETWGENGVCEICLSLVTNGEHGQVWSDELEGNVDCPVGELRRSLESRADAPTNKLDTSSPGLHVVAQAKATRVDLRCVWRSYWCQPESEGVAEARDALELQHVDGCQCPVQGPKEAARLLRRLFFAMRAWDHARNGDGMTVELLHAMVDAGCFLADPPSGMETSEPSGDGVVDVLKARVLELENGIRDLVSKRDRFFDHELAALLVPEGDRPAFAGGAVFFQGPTSPCGLTHAQLEQACKNIGFDLSCGACAGVFFTGGSLHAHACSRSETDAPAELRAKLNLPPDAPMVQVIASIDNLLKLVEMRYAPPAVFGWIRSRLQKLIGDYETAEDAKDYCDYAKGVATEIVKAIDGHV